jgi:CBS domain-containing protein
MKVQEVMTKNVAACGARDSLNRAAQLMWECDCGCVPVLDDSGAVCGMITDRDICMAAYTQGLPLHQIAIDRVMSPHLYACSPEDTIESAESLMQRNKIRRVPVIDGNRLVGMLSLSDLLLRSPRAPRRDAAMRPDALVETLAIISQPIGDIARERDRVARASNGAGA